VQISRRSLFHRVVAALVPTLVTDAKGNSLLSKEMGDERDAIERKSPAGSLRAKFGKRALFFSEDNNSAGRAVPTDSSSVIAVESISELRKISSRSEAAFCRGYASPADGGGGMFVWHSDDVQPDDSGVIISPEQPGEKGRWIRQFTVGEIDVRWFGATGDGRTDDTLAFQKTRDYAKRRSRSDPQVASDPLGSVKIRIPAGTYLIAQPEALLDRTWPSSTLGLKYEGLGPGISSINYRPQSPGPLLYNNNAILFLRLSGLLFACNDGQSNFYESNSNGKAQDVRCDDVVWSGSWALGFKLSGTNTNSEYKWTSCTIAGGWDYFLDLDGSDQLLNYWFYCCKFWAWDGGGWVRARHGGHIKISDCDVSAWRETKGRPLFALLGTTHARGVCHFLCIGSRFEIQTDTAPVIQSQWPHGAITFINADFGSQAPWRSHDYIEALIEIGPAGHAMLRWQDCTHIGRHVYQAVGGSAPTSVSELYHFLADPLRVHPRVIAEYAGCTHLSASIPEDMIVLDKALENSSLCPIISFQDCRSEVVGGGRPVLPWNGTPTWNVAGATVLLRKIATHPIFSRSFAGTILDIPASSLITKVQICQVRDRPFSLADRVAVAGSGPEVVLVYSATDARTSGSWQVPQAGDYIVRAVLQGRSRGSVKLTAEGGAWSGANKIEKNGVFTGVIQFPRPGTINLLKDSEFDGSIVRLVIRRQNDRQLCVFEGKELQESKTMRDGLNYLIEGASGGLLTLTAEFADPDVSHSSSPWGILLIDYVG